MRKELVLYLGIISGVMLAIDPIMGSPASSTRWLIMLVVAINAILLNRAREDVFTNGFKTGIVAGACQTALNLLFINRLLANSSVNYYLYSSSNPIAMALLTIVSTGVAICIFYGLLIGLFSWLLHRILSLYCINNTREC